MIRLRQNPSSPGGPHHDKEKNPHHALLPVSSPEGNKSPRRCSSSSSRSSSSNTSPFRSPRRISLPSSSLSLLMGGNSSSSSSSRGDSSNNMMSLNSKKWCVLICLVLAVWKIINFHGNVGRSSSSYFLGRRNTSSEALIMGANTLIMMGGASTSVGSSLRRSIQRPKAILLMTQQQQQRVVPLRMPKRRVKISTNVLEHNPDLGGLKIEMMESGNAMREIPDGGTHNTAAKVQGKPTRKKSKHRSSSAAAGDEVEDEDDDDDAISKYMLPYADDRPSREVLLQDTNQTCTRRPWHRTIHPTCNSFHETDLHLLMTAGDPYYIGGGSYRTVYLATRGNELSSTSSSSVAGGGAVLGEDVVWKTSGLKHGIDADTVASFIMDGVVGAALTPHPRLVNMWGFCAVSMFSEVVSGGDMDKFQPYSRCKKKYLKKLKRADEKGLPYSFNNLTATEKISWALKMAEAVAVLHNYKGGTIVHGDIALRQFLISKTDGSVKLTDFNQAEALRRDDVTGDNCLFHSQHHFGNHRPPEMYREKHLANEKTDVWGLAIAFYSLLTGMSNFHDECDSEKNISKRVLNGEIPWIDERWKTKSLAEARLVDIIKQCFAYDPKDRIDINRVIHLLKEAQKEDENLMRRLNNHENTI